MPWLRTENAFVRRSPKDTTAARIIISTTTVAALIALAPYVSLAQSGKTPSPVTQVVQAEVKKALEAAGYKDVKIDLHTFVVQAKDPSGSPVMMLINPDSFTAAT
jgi:hypothetical protein